MKKMYFLPAIASFGIFALAGCGKTAENTNTAATQNKETGKKVLQPGDVSPDKAVKIEELVDGAIADVNDWKGKEVAVTGYVTGVSGSGGEYGYVLTLINENGSKSKNYMSCKVPKGDLPAGGLLNKTVEVKGKISRMEITNNNNSVELEPCELKK